MKKLHQVKYLQLTCKSTPSQWEGKTFSGRFIYIRYRYGLLQVNVAKTEYDSVYGGENADCKTERIGGMWHGYIDLEVVKFATDNFLDFRNCQMLEPADQDFIYHLTDEQLQSAEYKNSRRVLSIHPLKVGEHVPLKEGERPVEITRDKFKYFRDPNHKPFDLQDFADGKYEKI